MHLKSIDIAKLHIKNNVFLAPLAGYTNAVFRQMCYELGAGLTVTEMVSAKGLCYNSEKTKDLLYVTKGYVGVKCCQLFGSEPDIMRRAAESEAIAPFDIIDINMGCPMPKIYNNGEGSALMNDFALASRIIRAVKCSGKAVTVKFRTGLKEGQILAVDFAKMCEDAGADMITVHGRTRDKIYAGEVDAATIAKVKKAVKIPVIANGGIFSAADADRLMAETQADGVAIARGAMYSPWIFAEITGTPVADRQAIVLKQLEDTLSLYGERFALVFMRKMAGFYLRGAKDATRLRINLLSAATCTQLKQMLTQITQF